MNTCFYSVQSPVDSSTLNVHRSLGTAQNRAAETLHALKSSYPKAILMTKTIWNSQKYYCSLLQTPSKIPICIPLSTTNKMQRYTVFFIIVNALHVSCGFSALHQEL